VIAFALMFAAVAATSVTGPVELFSRPLEIPK
jgi:hypothetical protein